MFDSSYSLRFVQSDRNKTSGSESYLIKHIYTFWAKNTFGAIKYVVIVKEYEGNKATIDFYPKLQSINRFKLLTNQNKFGQIGGTLLKVMRDSIQRFCLTSLGFIAANLLDEENNHGNKRFRVYHEGLRRVVDEERFTIFASEQNSCLFVINNSLIQVKDQIIEDYGKIFSETS